MELILEAPSMRVLVKHEDQELQWGVTAFDRKTLVVDFDMFEQINAYWKYCTKEEQSNCFNIFRRLAQAFDEIRDRNVLTETIKNLVAELYEILNLEDIKRWVLYKSNIYIPSTLSTEYIPNNDQPGSREQTYLREDYVELVCFSLALRPMLPIWGEYIYRTRQEAGTTFKEFYAYMLLGKTKLANCPAVIKLREYVESNTPVEPPDSAIIYGVSSEDYPVWILALVVVRRVCIGDIRGTDLSSLKLVTYVYKFIAQKVKGSDSSFSGRVMPKDSESGGNDEESGASKFESYKIREDATIGDRVYLEHALSDMVACANKICPGIDNRQLKAALQFSKTLENEQLNDASVTIAKWVFSTIVPPRSFVYINKSLVTKALITTQCILWYWGFPDIGAILTAKPLESGSSIRISNQDMKKFTPQLNHLYPFQRRPSSKSKTEKPVNHAVSAIEIIAEMLGENDWLLTIDENLLKQWLGENAQRRYMIPSNFRSRLTTLLINEIIPRSSKYNPASMLAV